jgi:hypothetical protein
LGKLFKLSLFYCFMSSPKEAKYIVAKAKRLDEFTNWLKGFKQLLEEENIFIHYINDNIAEVAGRLNDWYWMRRETDLEPYMEPEDSEEEVVINQYKIISGLELAVVGFQPIVHEDDTKRSGLNAELAWFIGQTFLIEWNNLDREKVIMILKKQKIEGFVTEHVGWLTKLDIQFIYPIFSNSHTWWNLHTCIDLYLGNEKPLSFNPI